MATGPLRFPTSHIEELPIVQSRHAPGFSYVTVVGVPEDPSKNWGTTNRKRVKPSVSGQTEQQKEALTARQQREIERKIRELNSDQARVDIPIPSSSNKVSSAGGVSRVGKTTNTKKILASGKTFSHYLDDEEAEIARTGKRGADWDVQAQPTQQRPSKTPIARRKAREETMSNSPAPTSDTVAAIAASRIARSIACPGGENDAEDLQDIDDDLDPLPSVAEIEALLNVPPLTYNQARARSSLQTLASTRKFCESCGYWGRVKCLRCGVTVCTVECKDSHDQFKCLKMYA